MIGLKSLCLTCLILISIQTQLRKDRDTDPDYSALIKTAEEKVTKIVNDKTKRINADRIIPKFGNGFKDLCGSQKAALIFQTEEEYKLVATAYRADYQFRFHSEDAQVRRLVRLMDIPEMVMRKIERDFVQTEEVTLCFNQIRQTLKAEEFIKKFFLEKDDRIENIAKVDFVEWFKSKLGAECSTIEKFTRSHTENSHSMAIAFWQDLFEILKTSVTKVESHITTSIMLHTYSEKKETGIKTFLGYDRCLVIQDGKVYIITDTVGPSLEFVMSSCNYSFYKNDVAQLLKLYLQMAFPIFVVHQHERAICSVNSDFFFFRNFDLHDIVFQDYSNVA
jgi:hypothetical protein